MEKEKILDSWKQIAAYLKRSEKTCYRWEHELDLPVHRIEDSPKARVYAYKDELDRWMEKALGFKEFPTEKTPSVLFIRIRRRLLSKKMIVFYMILICLAIIASLIW